MKQHPSVVRGGNRQVRTLALTVVVVGLLALLVRGIGFPLLGNPFGTETVDRSSPPLLTSLMDLSRFQAASGTYQVVVDVEKDVKRVPSLVAGERTLFLAQGSVDAYVDFTGLGKSSVMATADGSRVDITLPHAALSEARVDPKNSRVISRDRGVLDRLGGVFSDDPTSDRELFVKSQERMAAAARESGLTDRAEDNTKKMLTELLAPLGYDDVRITYKDDVRP